MIELADMMRELRHELAAALADEADQDDAVRFELGPVQAAEAGRGCRAKYRLVFVDRLMAALVHLRHGVTHDVVQPCRLSSAATPCTV